MLFFMSHVWTTHKDLVGEGPKTKQSWTTVSKGYLETECRLFPPVRIFPYLFLCAGYFFNAFD